MPTTGERTFLIGVVGPCAAGKTTLIKNLEDAGIRCRHIAQEHSFVVDMWQRVTNPDVLIFLDASYPVTKKRRNLTWSLNDYLKQQHRLRHAREHADLLLQTDHLTEKEVFIAVKRFLDDFYAH